MFVLNIRKLLLLEVIFFLIFKKLIRNEYVDLFFLKGYLFLLKVIRKVFLVFLNYFKVFFWVFCIVR